MERDSLAYCIIVLSISCSLSNTILKVKNRMVVSVSVVYIRDGVAAGFLGLPAAGQHHKIAHRYPGKRSRFKIHSTFSTECISLSRHRKVEKL